MPGVVGTIGWGGHAGAWGGERCGVKGQRRRNDSSSLRSSSCLVCAVHPTHSLSAHSVPLSLRERPRPRRWFFFFNMACLLHSQRLSPAPSQCAARRQSSSTCMILYRGGRAVRGRRQRRALASAFGHSDLGRQFTGAFLSLYNSEDQMWCAPSVACAIRARIRRQHPCETRSRRGAIFEVAERMRIDARNAPPAKAWVKRTLPLAGTAVVSPLGLGPLIQMRCDRRPIIPCSGGGPAVCRSRTPRTPMTPRIPMTPRTPRRAPASPAAPPATPLHARTPQVMLPPPRALMVPTSQNSGWRSRGEHCSCWPRRW